MSSDLASADVTVATLSQEFDQIFREHHQFVYRTAYGITGSSEDADDVLQTIFLRLLRREFPPDLKKNPKAYLYRAAVNVSLNALRLRQRNVLTGNAESLEAAADTETDSLERLHKRLYDAIAELDADAAQMIVLRYVHNYSDADIAKLLGKTRGVIAVRLFRSRARLKKFIRALEEKES
jgi:RNA polymerase sigma-70 factor (ECF subfamily)